MNNNLMRKNRIRAKISGTKNRPRASIFRSNKHIYVQLIDDVNAKTILSASDVEMDNHGKNVKMSEEIGRLLADKCKKSNIKEIVFDRNGKKYHGRIEALAKSARNSGLKF